MKKRMLICFMAFVFATAAMSSVYAAPGDIDPNEGGLYVIDDFNREHLWDEGVLTKGGGFIYGYDFNENWEEYDEEGYEGNPAPPIVDGAIKLAASADGDSWFRIGFSGNKSSRYLILRIKGEKGGEESGFRMGFADGVYKGTVTANQFDKFTATTPIKLTTEYQNIVIDLPNSKIIANKDFRKDPENPDYYVNASTLFEAIHFNFSGDDVVYIDGIYMSDSPNPNLPGTQYTYDEFTTIELTEPVTTAYVYPALTATPNLAESPMGPQPGYKGKFPFDIAFYVIAGLGIVLVVIYGVIRGKNGTPDALNNAPVPPTAAPPSSSALSEGTPSTSEDNSDTPAK